MCIGYGFATAQGCSDAGFCTMGALKPDQTYSRSIDFKLRSLELNYYRGTTTLSPIVTVFTADLTVGINDLTSIQVKLPYQTVSGTLGDTQGIGDISISASRILREIGTGHLGATIGAKIPSGKAKKQLTDTEFGPGGDLPMYYQISLGSYDAVAGISYINDKWLFATGIQMPLVHINENDFRWGQWPDYPNQDGYLRKYPLANRLKRGTDIMLRIERNWRFVNYNFSLGALPIYRITRDERYNFTSDIRQKENGTTGLALSVLASFGYSLDVNNSLKLIYGRKLADRKLNPDGLTRHDVISFSYIYRF